jgi:hypothetical protein
VLTTGALAERRFDRSDAANEMFSPDPFGAPNAVAV